jgi:hypothetical protein
MQLIVPEILSKVSKARNKELKKAILKEYESAALCTILQMNFDKSIEFALPDGRPPYVKDDAPVGHANSNLFMEIKKIKYFIRGLPDCEKLKQTQRENLFITFLESIHDTEAEMILDAREHKLNITGVNSDMIEEIWPGMLKDPLEVKKAGRPKVQESEAA